MRSPTIAAIVPTYNEPDLLQRCVESIRAQGVPEVSIIAVNAGEPLPEHVTGQVVELRVPNDYFWTACVKTAFDYVRANDFDLVLLANADNVFAPGCLPALLDQLERTPNDIACSPAYLKEADKPQCMMYSDQRKFGFLLYGYLNRRWNSPSEAPPEPIEIELTGGQGVLFSSKLLKEADVDVRRFPHYCSDHDFWLTLQEKGHRLILVPRAGIVNLRLLSEKKSTGFLHLLKSLGKRMTSEYMPESWPTMWRLRRKHLTLPAALLSTLISFTLRWTVGLRKIIRRT